MALIGGRKFGLRVHAFVVVWPQTKANGSTSLEPEPEPEPASSSGGDVGVDIPNMSVYTYHEAILTKCGKTYDPTGAI